MPLRFWRTSSPARANRRRRTAGQASPDGMVGGDPSYGSLELAVRRNPLIKAPWLAVSYDAFAAWCRVAHWPPGKEQMPPEAEAKLQHELFRHILFRLQGCSTSCIL